MYQNYRSPPGLDWDSREQEDDFEDDHNLETYNAEKNSLALLKYLDEMYPVYGNGHVLVPMGEDFNYANAFENFNGIDRLVAYFNKYHGDKY